MLTAYIKDFFHSLSFIFQVAELMAEELGWNEDQIEAEIKDAEGLMKSMG